MSKQEALGEHLPLNRGNSQAHDPRPNNLTNNVGTGLTATLTRNYFPDSFPAGEIYLKEFSIFLGQPQKVIGQGGKYIQYGTKSSQAYVDYNVGDTLMMTIPDQFKLFECYIGHLKVRMQISSYFPVYGQTDKFIDVGEYVEFENRETPLRVRSIAHDKYNMMRGLFMSSCFGACLPTDEYTKLLLKTLALPKDTTLAPDLKIHSPLTRHMLAHADTYKALADEMNKKISNKGVFDCHDVIHNSEGCQFDITSPGNHAGLNQDAIRRLKNCLVCEPAKQAAVRMPEGSELPDGRGQRLSREQSLLAMETVMVNLLRRCERPTYLTGQGNCGNIHGRNIEDVWNDPNYPVLKERYPANMGTTIMDKPMTQRPMLEVTCPKEFRVMVMGRADYNDFEYFTGNRGVFGEGQVARVNFNRVKDLVGDFILIDDYVPGHFIILDKRMLPVIPHLNYSGVDTLAQRMATVKTEHDWGITGMFDQFVAMRVQMTSFTGNAIDMNNIFLLAKDLKMLTNSDAVAA